MTQVPSIEETVKNVLHEALNLGIHAGVDMSEGLEIINDLRQEFPEAKIATVSLPEIVAAVQESIESEAE